MSQSLRIAIVDAFTRVAGEGNRAGVVIEAARLDAQIMQATARAIAASETAFLVSDCGGECRLRFFTPTAEIPFCGHATVAMLHFLSSESHRLITPRSLSIDCAAGRFQAEIETADSRPRVWLTTPLFPWTDSPVDEGVIMELLGSTTAERESRLPIRRSGPKLFVPLRCRGDLFALQPKWERLVGLAREHGVLGVFAFTRDVLEEGSVAHGRYFTPAQGVREDPVTGAANGPLAEYLALHGEIAIPSGEGTIRVRSEQGDAIGKPGRVDLEVTTSARRVERVRIGGVAVTVLIGELHPEACKQGGHRT